MGFVFTKVLFGETFSVRGGQGDNCHEGYGCLDGALPHILCMTEC